MIESPILKTKYATQKKLNKRAKNSLKKYSENAHDSIKTIEKTYNIKFKYLKTPLKNI